MLRNEDLDRSRCRPEFTAAILEDLRWFGLQWQEGPDCGGPLGPYQQSERLPRYRVALEQLKAGGLVYPCICSRKDILSALGAPHDNEEEPVYPGTCRPLQNSAFRVPHSAFNWRFRVPDGEVVSFIDGHSGLQQFTAGRDFGDFVIWRHDDLPAYQLAVVVDDDAMRITEVVRGADLLRSTARQLLIYRALGLKAPAFYHCLLVTDESGLRLAKRTDAFSLRALRQRGDHPAELRSHWVC